MGKKISKVKHDTVVDADTLTQDVVAPARVLWSYDEPYVCASNKYRGIDALVSIFLGHTGRKVSFSVKQLKEELDYDSANDWLDIRYDDVNKAVLIGKNDGQKGIKPNVKEKKLIIYCERIVRDFIEVLQLDLTKRLGFSAYTFKREEIEGKKFIVVSQKDFLN